MTKFRPMYPHPLAHSITSIPFLGFDSSSDAVRPLPARAGFWLRGLVDGWVLPDCARFEPPTLVDDTSCLLLFEAILAAWLSTELDPVRASDLDPAELASEARSVPERSARVHSFWFTLPTAFASRARPPKGCSAFPATENSVFEQCPRTAGELASVHATEVCGMPGDRLAVRERP
jgi:hypothetical protein